MTQETEQKTIHSAEYRRIESDLRRRIATGQWASGTMVPSRRDLARHYAVSPLTINRAIEPLLADGTLRSDNRRGTFVAETAQKAERSTESAEDAFHRPLTRSSARVGQKTVAVITFFLSANYQEYVILHTLEQIFASSGSTIHVVNRATEGGPTLRLSEAIERALEGKPDGLIIIALEQDSQVTEEDLDSALLQDIPTVCILPGEISRPIPHVFYDSRSGGYQAMQHLIGKGITDFTIVAPFTATWVNQRILGCQGAVLHAGLSVDAIKMIRGDNHPYYVWEDPKPLAYEAVKAEMASGWIPSGGIVCVSDGIAFGVLDAAAEHGFLPGKDFAILGFDDDYNAQVRGLTSLRPPLAAMAREAANLLQDHWQGIDASLQVRLRAHVIPRMSSNLSRDA